MNEKIKKQITVFAGCVVKDNKVLMLKRYEKECAEAHLKWEFPGGKVDFGETPQEAVKRELREETGVKVKVKTLLPFSQVSYWDYEWGIQQTLCFCFFCKFIDQLPVEKDHHVAEIAWIDLDKVKDLKSLPGTNEIIALTREYIEKKE